MPFPDGAEIVSSASGDLDGDGLVDQVHVYQLGDVWATHVVLGYGYETDRTLADLMWEEADSASVSAVVDVGQPAALVMLGGTLIGRRYGFLVLDECSLVPVTLSGGKIPDIYDGSGLMHSEWFVCSPSGVTQISVTKTEVEGGDIVPATLREWPYQFRPVDVVFVPEQERERGVTGTTLEELWADFPPCMVG